MTGGVRESSGTVGRPAFLAIVGPTASGKTALSLALAERLDVEIISMDSRQIYRGMDIGTGKATREERARIPHFGLDLRDPDERYSAGQFSRDARRWMKEIQDRGHVPLLVGGTGFFLRSLMNPMFSQPAMDGKRLQGLRDFLNGLPGDALLKYVGVLDPDRAALAREGGRQRSTRTVEVALMTGRPLSWWHREGETSEEAVPGVVTVLNLPRDLLYARIDERVGRMVEEGLVEEVRGLLADGYGPTDPGMTGAGYREVVAFLQGEVSLEEALEEIRRSHRRYARRQITWNRHQLPMGATVLDGTRPGAELVEGILAAWAEGGGQTTREDEGLNKGRRGS